MRHDAGKLRLCLGRLDRAQVYKDRPAGQGEGVDVLHIHDVEVVGPLVSRSIGHQAGAKLLHVAAHRAAIRKHRHLLIDILCGLLPLGNLLLLGEGVLAGMGSVARPP